MGKVARSLIYLVIAIAVSYAVRPMSAPAQEPAGEIPVKYVGKWTGVHGQGWSISSDQEGTAAVNVDFGHVIDTFEFEVLPDGSVNGSGTATYKFKTVVDAHLIAGGRKADGVEIRGKSQQVQFNIAGKMSAEGKLALKATPQEVLNLVGGKAPTMEAWNVFGGVAGTAELQVEKAEPRFRKLVVDAFGATAINGKTTKLGWLAKKKPSRAVQIYVDAFLPPERLEAPRPSQHELPRTSPTALAESRWYHAVAGDNRGFIKGHSARLWTSVTVDLDAPSALVEQSHGAKPTRGFRYKMERAEKVKEGKEGAYVRKEIFDDAQGVPFCSESVSREGDKVIVKIDGAAKIPLIENSPEADYHYTITLTPNGSDDVDYKVEGKHGGFPAYSVYLENDLVHKRRPAGHDMLAPVNRPPDVSVSVSGKIAGGPVPPGPQSPKVPRMYVGKWTDGFGKVLSFTRNVAPRAKVTKDLGNLIDKFEFDVADDGTITGQGTATYWFDVSSEIDAALIKKSPDARLDGNLQKIDFTISGKVTADGKFRLIATPSKELVVVHSRDKKGPLDAWNVFGGIEGSVERGEEGLVVRASGVLDPEGLKFKVAWKAKKVKLLDITALALNDIDDVALEYLSAAAHTYFEGNTHVHGTITVVGPKDEKLESLLLEVVQKGKVVATADLAQDASSVLVNVPFGADEKLVFAKSKLLFELLSSEAAKVDGSQNGELTLRVKAQASDGQETTKEFGQVEILVRYTKDNRMPGSTRDPHRGGDDWVKPSVKKIIEDFSDFTWNDFSNMNGGSFAPDHKSHKRGNDVDGYFVGFNDRDATVAQKFIDALNKSAYGSEIMTIYVTFTPAFEKAIEDVVLDDGRKATSVFNDEAEHDTHFHFVIRPEPVRPR